VEAIARSGLKAIALPEELHQIALVVNLLKGFWV
jgi:hypothetical protein